MQITPRILRIWADDNRIPDLTLAELDYRLTQALAAIYGDPWLREALFDLFHIGAFPLDERAVRKLTLYYFYHARMIFDFPTFQANLEEKLGRRAFADDVRSLIRSGERFEWEKASRAVLQRFGFLGELDERDRQFLDLARLLLGRPLADERKAAVAHIDRPLAWLMEGFPISQEAAQLDVADIQVFQS